MNSPLVLEQLAASRQEAHLREAAAERLAQQAQARSGAEHPPHRLATSLRARLAAEIRLRLSAWLYALAARLASGTVDPTSAWDPRRHPPVCPDGVDSCRSA